jgi:cytochrome oxidase Cu insertion factor (SCO1/SenC/PrrC family)
MTSQVKIWLSLLLAVLIAYTSFSSWRFYQRSASATSTDGRQPRHIERTRPTGSLADTELVDTSGQPFALDALRGKVWLASFFFTSCPGPCAQMNRAIAGLQNDVKDENLKFVSVTVDPANDTPEVLAKYARGFLADPKRWIFLSGPFERVVHLGQDAFQVVVGPKMHTERVILVDKGSNVRGMYLTSDPNQMLALHRKIKELLAEEAPPNATESPKEATGVAPTGVASHDDSAGAPPPESADQIAPAGPPASPASSEARP